jgi:hypothetical protein
MQHDFACADHVSLASITPLTGAAADWLTENVEPAEIGTPILAEPRFSLDIALGMIGAGLTCENSHLIGEVA